MKKMNALLWISMVLLVSGLVVMAKDYSAILTDLDNLRQDYILKRNITGFLTFLIGLCGIATSTFQKLKKAWAQRAIFWLGTIIAVLTLLQSTFFPSSFQDYSKSAYKIDMTIRNITLLQNELNFAATPEEKAALENEIRQTIMDFYNAIEYEPLTHVSGFVSPLYVQVIQMAAPKWVHADRYSDANGNFCFVGTATHSRLSTAKLQSRKLAKLKAVAFWQAQIETKFRDLGESLAEYGEYETGHFERHADSTFTYSTLFKMQKSVLPFAIKFYEIDNKKSVPNELTNKIIDTQLPKMHKK